MKRKITLIAGCSHSAGSEIDGTEDSKFNRDNAFGSLLSKKLDREPINIAINGGTNATIARSILNWFGTQYDENTMDVVVVVGWTEPSRLEIPWYHDSCYETGNTASSWFDETSNRYNRVLFGWKGGTPEEKEVFEYFYRFMAEQSTILEIWSANLILQMQYFFKSMGVKYIMCNTLHMFTPDIRSLEPLLNLIDNTCYYDLYSTQDEAFYWKYRHMGYINEKAKYWHHSIEPHQLFAEELYKFSRENKCLE